MALLVSKMTPKFFQLGVEEKSRHVRKVCMQKVMLFSRFSTIVSSVDV